MAAVEDGRRVLFLAHRRELITQARIAVDEVISSVGRKTIETILTLSAEQVAGARTPGKTSGDIRWHLSLIHH